jgi:hypothetical protein
MLCTEQQLRADFRSYVRRRLMSAVQLFGSVPKSEYQSIVTDFVTTLASQRIPYGDIYARSLGAFPTLVKEALQKSRSNPGIAPDASAVPLTAECEWTPWEDDELDPIDAQWYFDMPTAQRIVGMFASGTNSVLALGTPTVASVAASKIDNVTLVDISQRFTRDADAAWPALKNVNITCHDLDEEIYSGVTKADVVVMDPPWYIESYQAWLHSAVSNCRSDGMLVVALPQILTSRRSLPERQAIIAILEKVGNVQLVPDALTYLTPSFELPVLEASDLQFLKQWRHGDIAVINVRKTDLPYEFPAMRNIQWKTRNVYGRIVRTCYENLAEGTLPVIEPFEGTSGYRLTQVTRNYLWSSSANLVTSRGRAATVTTWGALPHILDLLEAGYEVESSVGKALPSASTPDRTGLAGTLSAILRN